MSGSEIYQPLNNQNSEIRLIELISTSHETVIECRLSKVSLNHEPNYSALSYVWGDKSITETILVDGHPLQVTTNLAAALRHVKSHWQRQFPGRNSNRFRLFADAICINQNDIVERGSQVQLMETVYSQAGLVISWLGRGYEEIELAFKTLHVIGREARRIDEEQKGLVHWMRKYPELCVDGNDRAAGNPALNSIRAFATLEYWHCAWIHQEIVLGKRILLTYGLEHLHFDDLWLTINWWYVLQSQILTSSLSKPNFLGEVVWSQLGQSMSIRRCQSMLFPKVFDNPRFVDNNKAKKRALLWHDARYLRASDPRDQMYALMGLTKIRIIPDYQKSIVEVYCDYISAMLKKVSIIGWLSWAGIRRFDVDSEDKYPSWIPRFREMSEDTDWTMLGLIGAEHKGLCKDHVPCAEVIDRKLVVSGLVGPIVVKVHQFSDDYEKMADQLVGFVFDLQSRSPTYVTGCSPLEALYRVIIRYEEHVVPAEEYPKRLYVFAKYFLLLAATSESDLQMYLIQRMLPFSVDDLKAKMGSLPKSCDPVVLEEFAKLTGKLCIVPGYHRFFETEDGYLGLGPQETLPGDIYCIIKDCISAFVIRKVEDHYVIVGGSWVYGLTKDTMARRLETGKASIQRLEIW